MSKIFHWKLGEVLDGTEDAETQRALIVLNQPLRNLAVLTRIWHSCGARLAADGGANRMYDLVRSSVRDDGVEDGTFGALDIIIGDLDSLRDDVRKYYSTAPRPASIIHDQDQDTTDFAKAISHIRDNNLGKDIVAVGSIGGRVDQGISQLHHLFLFQPGDDYVHGRIWFASDESLTILLKPGIHRIDVREGCHGVFDKYVGILPLKEASLITTRGLEWDVQDWETSMGGRMSTSNHVLPDTNVVLVETTKEVLFTISIRQD